MKRDIPEPAADERLERLLDEDLRAIARSAEVDLRARVAAALARVPASESGAAGSRFGAPAAGFQVPRWAIGLAAAGVIVFAVLIGWRATSGVEPRNSELPKTTTAARPIANEPAVAQGSARVEVAPTGEVESRAPAVGSPARRPRGAQVPDAEPATVPAEAVASAEPYLPGAPAGELGDPLQPLPAPPPISFAPIASAPPVSESARPVTEFPADNPAPGVPVGTTGHSGGSRR
jgi:hypothetical protein